MTEIAKTSEAHLKLGNASSSQDLIDFINNLKSDPDSKKIKLNAFANNSKYLPIGHVEDQLDYYFHGLWKTTNFEYRVIVNEITCSLILHVWHPIAKAWIERIGTASVQIQLRAEYEMIEGKRVKKEVDVTDVSKKIANTITKDLPHAKSEALKNAAKSLGVLFGRNLNREIEDEPAPYVTPEDAEIMITSIDNKADLNKYYAGLPKEMKQDRRIKTILLKHQEFLKSQGK